LESAKNYAAGQKRATGGQPASCDLCRRIRVQQGKSFAAIASNIAASLQKFL
jgi:hypothetical protein